LFSDFFFAGGKWKGDSSSFVPPPALCRKLVFLPANSVEITPPTSPMSSVAFFCPVLMRPYAWMDFSLPEYCLVFRSSPSFLRAPLTHASFPSSPTLFSRLAVWDGNSLIVGKPPPPAGCVEPRSCEVFKECSDEFFSQNFRPLLLRIRELLKGETSSVVCFKWFVDYCFLVHSFLVFSPGPFFDLYDGFDSSV